MISAERLTVAKPKGVSAKKKLLFATLTVSWFFIGLFLALEIGYRAYRLYRPVPVPKGAFERSLGWSPKPGKRLSLRASFKSTHDEAWADGVDPWFTIDENGFRRRDSATNPGPAVFLLGDSFTEAAYSGTGGTYFDRLTQDVPCRMHVFGSSGYGTLQETLVLEKYVSSIRPDIVMLQLCTNDLYDNDPGLASLSLLWDPGQPRPFLEDDDTVDSRIIRYSGPGHLLLSRSLFLKSLVRRFRLVRWRSPFEFQDQPEYASAVERTGRILKRFRQSCGDDTVVLAFAECAESEEAVYRNLCQEAGITYLDGVSGALRDEARKAGNPELGRYDGPRGHYDLFGHHVIGNALVPHIRQAIANLK